MTWRPVMPIGILLCFSGLNACGPQKRLPIETPHYTIGAPWQGRGGWFYPQEDWTYDATGLAVVDTKDVTRLRRTADGEWYNAAKPSGAHQTLQLPVMLRVRNLENGREIALRINDRGPATASRVLSITPGAASLLGISLQKADRATRVRLTEDQPMSRDLLQQVAGAPAPDLAAAPVAAVREESLTPGKQSPSIAGQTAMEVVPRCASVAARAGDVVVFRPDPGHLWIDGGQFGTPGPARQVASLIGGYVRGVGSGHATLYRVRLGPFDMVSQADAALDRALAAGVTGAKIIVE